MEKNIMFWENFLRLCMQTGKTPTSVISELRISRGSLTRWKNGSVPQASTLEKIALYFGVSSESLVNRNTSAVIGLSEHEKALIIAYRQQEHMQSAVDKLLSIDEDDIVVYVAAKSDGGSLNEYRIVKRSRIDEFRSTPETDEELI